MAKSKKNQPSPAPLTTAMAFINKLAPTHEKISCGENAKANPPDTTAINSRYAADDFGGCYRCTLMEVHNLAVSGELAPPADEDEDQ